jgi:hypothetical protein
MKGKHFVSRLLLIWVVSDEQQQTTKKKMLKVKDAVYIFNLHFKTRCPDGI